MRAITYARLGDPSVLELVERPIPEPGEGELLIRVLESGVNPTDWKSRSGSFGGAPTEATVPNHDRAGIVDAVGPGVSGFSAGDRVWVTLAGDGRPAGGTAQEYTVVPAERAFALPAGADFELGASIGIPAATAHRALTVAEDGPTRLRPDALGGRAVLVAGGAGAMGNAAIQLARWAGAEVIATVSGNRKAGLATAAGAHHVVNYTEPDAAEAIRSVAPAGVDVVVEVAAGANSELDLGVLRPRGAICVYASEGGAPFSVDVRRNMGFNARYQFILLYTVGWDRIAAAAADINEAIQDGAFRVGERAGLPLHRYQLEDAAAAHGAVESGAVGKVLITLQASHNPARLRQPRRFATYEDHFRVNATLRPDTCQLLVWTRTRSARGDSCFLIEEQSGRTAWRARSLLSWTSTSCAGRASCDDCSAKAKQQSARLSSARSLVVLSESHSSRADVPATWRRRSLEGPHTPGPTVPEAACDAPETSSVWGAGEASSRRCSRGTVRAIASRRWALRGRSRPSRAPWRGQPRPPGSWRRCRSGRVRRCAAWWRCGRAARRIGARPSSTTPRPRRGVPRRARAHPHHPRRERHGWLRRASAPWKAPPCRSPSP
jgi:NADPH2:quinone reductase